MSRLFLLFFLLMSCLAQSTEILVEQNLTRLDLTQALDTLLETKDTPDPISLEKSDSFNTYWYQKSLSPSRSAFWYRVQLIPKQLVKSKALNLTINSQVLQHLDIYQFQGNKLIDHAILGVVDRPKSQKKYQGLHYAFNLPPDEPITLLIRKQNLGPPMVSFTLMDNHQLKTHNEYSNLFWGASIAVILALTFYNAVVFFYSMGWRALGYLGFQISAFAYISVLHGFGYLYLPEGLMKWLTINIGFLNYSLVFFGLYFTQTFLKSKYYSPWLNKAASWIFALVTVAFLTSPFTDSYVVMVAFMPVLSATFIIVIAMGACSYFRGFKPSRFFLLAWVMVLAGGSIGYLTFSNYLPFNFFTIHSFMFGMMAKLLLLSIALAERLSQSEAKILQQSFIDPDTERPNKNFFYQHFPAELKAINKAYPKAVMVVLHMEGYHELVGVLGSNELRNRRQEQRQAVQRLLDEQPWIISFKIPGGLKFNYITMEVGQMVMIINPENDLAGRMANLQSFWRYNILKDNYLKGVRLKAGIVPLCQMPDDADELFRRAYTAFIEAQSQHLDWLEYAEIYDELFLERQQLLSDLRNAIEQNELTIFVQPKMNLSNEELCSAEALVRWNHPTKGLLPPFKFIELAEKAGLIFHISKVVLEHAFKWLNTHPAHMSLSVNLSMMDLKEPKLIEEITALNEKFAIDPRRLTIELTESQEMEQSPTVFNTISKLKALGFKISIDDFGTGYSSLLYISKLMPHELKIDRTFARNIHLSPVNQIIVKNIVAMAKTLGAQTVVEGIELEEELIILKSFGCDIGQGFYWNQPLPQDEFKITYLINKEYN